MTLIANKIIKPRLGYISDGDTLSITYLNNQYPIRLRWIDCCETKKSNQNSGDFSINLHWQYAQLAKEFIKNLLTNQIFILIPIKQDNYGRWLSDLYINKVSLTNNIQLKIIKEGLATYFIDDFAKYDFSRRELTLFLEIIKNCAKAYDSKVGFWKETDFILPADFKKITW